MPYSFTIYPSVNLLVFRPAGILTEADVLSYFRTVRQDPNYHPRLNRIVDNQELKDMHIDYAQMRNIVQNEVRPDASGLPPVKSAFVSISSTDFGMARMYQSVSDSRGGNAIKICDSFSDALRYLEVDPVAFAALTRQDVD